MSQPLPDSIRCRKQQCDSCVFRPESEGGVHLAPERHAEIRAYLIRGQNQLCHHDDNRPGRRCGRDFQLMVWAEMGVIAEPTEQALREAMLRMRINPKRHI